MDVEDQAALTRAPEVERLIRGEIQRLTTGLADHEKIRRFSLLEQELTMEAGELTPTLKIKRRVVLEKYKQLIDSLSRQLALVLLVMDFMVEESITEDRPTLRFPWTRTMNQ